MTAYVRYGGCDCKAGSLPADANASTACLTAALCRAFCKYLGAERACQQPGTGQSFGKSHPVTGNAEAAQTEVTDVCWVQGKGCGSQLGPAGFSRLGAVPAGLIGLQSMFGAPNL